MARTKRIRNCKRCGAPTPRGQVYCSRDCWSLYCIEHLPDRFWAKVKKTDTCWVWQGRRNESGHGMFRIGNTMELAHRVAWELLRGPIPDGLCALHHCDNAPCCRAEVDGHLYLGTRMDNKRDQMARGHTNYSRGDEHYHRKRPETIRRGEQVPWTKLTADQVLLIRARFADGESRMELAKAFGMNWNTIDSVVKRKTWTHI